MENWILLIIMGAIVAALLYGFGKNVGNFINIIIALIKSPPGNKKP